MIDYFNISIKGSDFPAIGKELRTKQPSGAKTKSFTDVMVRVATGAPHFHMKVESRAKRIKLWGSPAQFLQCHNGMGSNDFRSLVKASVLLAFETLRLDCPRSVLDAISSGEYEVHEVHVAEQYRMPHALVRGLCDNIRRNADSSLQAVPLEKGIGVRLFPNSRDRQILIYDKHHYFMDGLMKHRIKLLGKMPRDFARSGRGLEFEMMMNEVLAKGIRIETRLKRLLNRKINPLNRGNLWISETARQLHCEVLRDVPLSDLPPISVQEQLLATVSTGHKRLIALWLTGRNMQQFFDSDATYYRRRKIMLKLHNIDLSIKPIPNCGIKWSDVISPCSIIEVPAWAKQCGFVYEPGRKCGWSNPTQNHRAWLNPEPPIQCGKRRAPTER